LLQALFRRYAVRKIHGATVDERLEALKERRTRERLRLIEERRKQDAVEDQQLRKSAVFQTELDEELDRTDRISPIESKDMSTSNSTYNERVGKLDKLPHDAEDILHHQSTMHDDIRNDGIGIAESEDVGFIAGQDANAPSIAASSVSSYSQNNQAVFKEVLRNTEVKNSTINDKSSNNSFDTISLE